VDHFKKFYYFINYLLLICYNWWVVSNPKCDPIAFSEICPSETACAAVYRQLSLDERRRLFRLVGARVPKQ
jgi:hypothetical protein